MANRLRAITEAERLWARQRVEVSNDLREAREALGLTQDEVARGIGVSRSRICRLELGRAQAVTHEYLARHAAAVGLRLSIKLYPAGGALRDAAQARYIARLVERIGTRWNVRLDVPIPLRGDLRAIDLLLHGSVTIAIEVVTRLRDLQALLRAAQLKQRDIGADRLVIVVAATHANRRALAEARTALLATFTLDTQRVLADLAAGRDPGRDAIIVLA